MGESLVVDASYTYELLVPGSEHRDLKQQMDSWRQGGIQILAPSLWLYEMTSVITREVCRHVLTSGEGRRLLGLAWALDVSLVPPDEYQVRRAYEWTCRLNRAATYDSFYLALAEVNGCELWTTDQRLQRTTNVPWVRVPSVGYGDSLNEDRVPYA
jgi:predicted nucleic acid-binding protein